MGVFIAKFFRLPPLRPLLGAFILFVTANNLQAGENPEPEPADASQAASDAGEPARGTGNFSPSPFRVSLSLREGYDDNVNTASFDPKGSFFTSGNAVLDYNFGNARTKLALEAFGGLTYYYKNRIGQDYDITTGFSLTASHQLTPRLGLATSLYLSYQSEPDFSTGIGIDRRVGNYFYTADKFSVSYQWAPRFSTVTSYTLSGLRYDDKAIGRFEDRLDHLFGNEFRLLVLPTSTLVAEYRYEITDYDTAPRNSTTQFALAGLDHSFNPRFNISARAGAQFRVFENFSEQTSPYGEATLSYALGERSTLTWNNRYGLDEPDVPGSAAQTSYRTGLRASYSFTPRFSSNLSLYYEHDNTGSQFTGTSFLPGYTNDILDLSAGVRYELNRTFAILAGYSHTQIFSDQPFRAYTRNRYYLGLNASF
jgi:hypothetical protein